MKNFFLAILFNSIVIVAFGQGNEPRTDTLLSKCIERFVRHPYYDNGGAVGVNILLISKQDSIAIKSIFQSDSKFDIPDLSALVKSVNGRCGNQIENLQRLVVPVYFYFNGETRLISKLNTETNRRLKKLRKKGYFVTTFPVTIIEFENLR